MAEDRGGGDVLGVQVAVGGRGCKRIGGGSDEYLSSS
jgi:hypothetical protein